jgi:hypothetical protein
VAGLLAALDCPFVVVADGMASPEEPAPDDAAWRTVAAAMEAVARRLQGMGMQMVIHLEAGSHLATPDEQARLCALTDPELVGICLTRGITPSFGDPREAVRQYGRRIRYVISKMRPGGAARSSEGLDGRSETGVFTLPLRLPSRLRLAIDGLRRLDGDRAGCADAAR